MTGATVFISCGQRQDVGELEIANQLAGRLRDEGFDPYVALQQQNLQGVKENIFAQLERSEYLIFIDFRREPIGTTDGPPFRGSLFSHQELAIAAFLDLEAVVFQENGVKRDDGILAFLQANSVQFTDRHTLPSVVLDHVHQRAWRPDWKRQLVLERDVDQHVDASDQSGEMRRFFHIRVRNLDHRRTATNCYVYLETVLYLDTLDEKRPETIEFKWEGYTLPNARILPGSMRAFDAVLVPHSEPARPRFSIFTDSTRFVPPIGGPGTYRLSFAVVSDNFPVARGDFDLRVAYTLDDWRLELWSP